MITVQHPSGAPTYEVEDPSPYLAVGWTAVVVKQLTDLTIAGLREYAAEREIDLTGLKTKPDIFAAIDAASGPIEDSQP